MGLMVGWLVGYLSVRAFRQYFCLYRALSQRVGGRKRQDRGEKMS